MHTVHVYHKVVKGRGEAPGLLLRTFEMVSGCCFLTGVFSNAEGSYGQR
jgi:hypothetical protein